MYNINKLVQYFKLVFWDASAYLSFSKLALHKYFVGLSISSTWNMSKMEVEQLLSQSLSDTRYKFSRYDLQILAHISFTLLKMIAFSMITRMLYRDKRSLQGWKYIYITYSDIVDITEVSSHLIGEMLVLHVPTTGIIKYPIGTYRLSHLQPSFAIISKIFRYYYYSGSRCSNSLYQALGKSGIIKFHDIVIKSFIYESWAEICSLRIKNQNPRAVCIFENDFGGPLLALVDNLNKYGIKTVHMQHGVYSSSDVEFIPPLARYMFYCSEREKDIQIMAGVKPENLYPSGLPFQSRSQLKILPTTLAERGDTYNYDYLILGGGGQSYVQEEGICLLQGVSSALSEVSVCIRNHPRISKKQKMAWSAAIPNADISPNAELLHDIFNAERIIAFSIDALSVCVIHKKEIVFIPTSSEINGYDYLANFPNINICKDQLQFMCAIKQSEQSQNIISQKEYVSLLLQNIGSFNDAEVRENILNGFRSIYNDVL